MKWKAIIYAIWGNFSGFFFMRFFGKLNDYSIGFKSDEFDFLVSLIFMVIVLGAPAPYFYIRDIQSHWKEINSGEKDISLSGFFFKTWESFSWSFLAGIPGIILGRIL